MTYENSSGPAGCRQNLPSLGNGERVPNDSQQESRCNSDGSGKGHATTHGWKCL